MSEEKNQVDDEVKEKQNSPNVVESPVCNEASSKISEVKTAEPVTINNTASEDSEYETLDEDEGGSSKSSRSRRSSFSEERDELSDDVNIEDEREDGDGQEENSLNKDKKLDDDEDRRNPQYIPKRGTFYEHDDRTVIDDKEEETNGNDTNRQEKNEEVSDKEGKAVVGPSVGPRKGKVWTEKADRWTHDLYIEEDQVPKSTQELIDTYGYDIRNEEAPPKARRRRKYGRGPNTYTRKWEDEDAYTRSLAGQRRVFHNNREDFPDLADTGRRREKPQVPGKKKPLQQGQIPIPATKAPPPQQVRERGEGERRPRKERLAKPAVQERKPQTAPTPIKPLPAKPAGEKQVPVSSNSIFPPPPIAVRYQDRQDKREERTELGVKVGRGRGFRGTGKIRPSIEFTPSRGRGAVLSSFNRDLIPQVEDSLKQAADKLIQDFSQVYINNNNNTNNIVEETIIPRSERRSHHVGGETQGEPTRSKRYSTQRQRSMPENTPPPAYSPPHNIAYYPQPPPASEYQHSSLPDFVPGPVYNDVAPPPVTSPPIQMMAFLPPGPPPTGAAPPYPPPPLINYMPPPTFSQMTLPPPISGQFEDLSQSAELYQGQGGITYYSTQSQSVHARSNPPRPRVKLAIPIIPPPVYDNSSGSHKQHGGSGKTQEVTSAAT